MDVCNLLIIDADPNIRKILGDLLAGRQDIHLLSAGSGPEAVKCFASNRVDVVLTDTHMPGFTGLELVADMKKIKFKPEILVMTADATPQSVQTSRQLGARSVILKPFYDLEIIAAEINKAVAAARAARGGDRAPVAASAGASPAAAKPAPAVATAAALPLSEPLPDFNAWNGDLTGNDTPVVSPPPVSARPAPAPIAVAPAPAASLRPVNGQGLRPAPKPAPEAAAARPTPEVPPVQHVPAEAPAARIAEAPRPPAVAPRAPVAVPASAPRPSATAPASAPHAPSPAPAPHAPSPKPPPRPRAVAVAPVAPAVAPQRAQAATGHPAAAHAEPARGAAPAIAPPPEEAVPEIPAALEGIFRTATRFDTGKLRMQVPIVCLQTWEEKGAIAALRRLAATLQREFYVWSVGKGLVKENGQSMGDIYREPGRALEFIRRHKALGLYVFADFRSWLEDKAVVRQLREMVMDLETARSMLVLTAPRLPAPPELLPVCAAFDWPAGGSPDPQALYEEVAEEVAAATGLGLDLPAADREALLKLIKDMPPGRARFEIARALMARAG